MKSEKCRASAFWKRALCAVLSVLLIFSVTAAFSACRKDDPAQPTNDADTTDNSTSTASVTADAGKTEAPAEADVKVVPTAASGLKLVDKDTEAFTMQIPEGWEIRYGWDGEKMLLIRVYDPETPVNQIFYATEMVPFMKSAAGAAEYAVNGAIAFSEAPVLDPHTNETLFKLIPKLRTYYLETIQIKNAAEMIPEIYNFQLLETLPANTAFGEDSLDNSIVYGTFRTADGSADGEAIGFASIVDLHGVQRSPLSGVDLAYYTVYHFTAVTAVKDELVNYEDILFQSLASLQLKQEFIAMSLSNNENAFNRMQEINASIRASYYSYNDAWLARSQSADISRQKYSDATLGYERVYDTETGDIYKAYNGFTDDYTGSRYQPVSDDMYTQGWSGYIEK